MSLVREHGVLALVHALESLGDCRRHPDEVSELVARAALPLPTLLPFLAWRAHGYARNLVYRDANFEVLLLSWNAGAASPIHDHDGQECWFRPLVGAFDLEDYCWAEGLEPLGRRTGVRSLDYQSGGAQIHRVAVSAGIERAISLHVYALPVDGCRIYDPTRGTVVWRALHYDQVPQGYRERYSVSAPR
jgi:cysteine dioxygenase